MNFRKIGLLLAVATTLSGCAAFDRANQASARVDSDHAAVTALAKSAQSQHPHVERDAVVFHAGSWASLVPIEVKQREARVKLLCKGNNRVSYSPRSPVDILEFSQFITNLCSVPIRVMPDAITAIQTQGRLSMAGNQGMPVGVPGMGGAIQPPIPAVGQPISQQGINAALGGGQLGNMAVGGRSGQIDIKYDGDLPGLLDMVTNRLGVSWKIADGSVSIYYLDTRTFRLFSQPYGYDVQSTVQSGTTTATGVSGGSNSTAGGAATGGISGSAGSQQNTTITMKSSRWDDIDKSIKQMLTPGVGRAQGSPSTGTYTVTDVPEVLGRIETYLDGENKSLTKQVVFNVKVLAVALSDSNGIGIDWTLVYKSLNGKWGFGLANVTQKDSAATSATLNMFTGEFTGTSAVINALAQQGRVSELMSPSVTTLNHHTVPVQIGSQVSYIASSQVTQTPQVGSTAGITPGIVTTGFNMRLTPYVMPDNQMLLDAAINVSALRKIRSVTSNGATAEMPELDNRIFAQTARLRAGETLILSGFEQINDTTNRSGVGDPSNILFGGSVNSSTNRAVVVILITPMLMD